MRFKASVFDQGFAISRELNVDRDSLKISGVNGGDALDHEFGRTQFHECFVNSAELFFDYRFRTARDHLFFPAGENTDFQFEKTGEEIERVPAGRIDFALEDIASFFVEEREDLLESFLAGAPLDLVDGFQDGGTLDLHHLKAPRRAGLCAALL
jgi:hypothetical protein